MRIYNFFQGCKSTNLVLVLFFSMFSFNAYSMSLTELWKELLIPKIIEYADESVYVPKVAKLIAKKELERSVLIKEINKPDLEYETNRAIYSKEFWRKYSASVEAKSKLGKLESEDY